MANRSETGSQSREGAKRKAWEPNPRTISIAKSFRENLADGYQYYTRGTQKEREAMFKQEIMGREDITKEDLVDWINERSYTWYINARVANEQPAD